MNSFLLNILADPQTGHPLTVENDGFLVNAANGNRYPVAGGVPRFVQPGNNVEVPGSSGFDYSSHYEQDAIAVDYFEEDEFPATRNERKRSRQTIIDEVPDDCKTILDIGCGGAWVAAHFLKKNRQVISMDISSVNPVKALRLYPHSNHAAIVADAFFLPFADGSLDCIIASEVIEHVVDPALFVKGLLKKLKPGGCIILMTPYNEKRVYHLCIHCNQLTPQNAHLHSFDEKKIAALVPKENTRIKNIVFCNKYLLKLRIYNLLAFLPLPAWRAVDKLANAIAFKPVSYVIKITKTN